MNERATSLAVVTGARVREQRQLPALVEPPERPEPSVTRSGDGAVLWTGPGGGRGVLVAGWEAPDVFELWDWTLGPGDGRSSGPHTAGAMLGAGDAAAFPGDAPHGYRNSGERPARFSLAVLEPDVPGAARGGAR